MGNPDKKWADDLGQHRSRARQGRSLEGKKPMQRVQIFTEGSKTGDDTRRSANARPVRRNPRPRWRRRKREHDPTLAARVQSYKKTTSERSSGCGREAGLAILILEPRRAGAHFLGRIPRSSGGSGPQELEFGGTG